MRRETSSMFNANKLKLGLFAPNCSSGIAATMVPERWEASWENNLALTRLVDEAGIEFMLPLARWKGYGGETDFQSSSLETITWACGLLAQTSQITVFGTVHVPLVHPIYAAKQMVTADHIGSGRFGLNIVCGWNKDEFDMFGANQQEHDRRYDHGQEWLDVVRKIWTSEESFDFEGDFINLKGVVAEPRPYGGTQPVLMNAGWSETGRAFAARNCDFLFTILLHPGAGRKDVRAAKQLAAAADRDVDVIATAYVVCRPTSDEAEEYHRHYSKEQVDTAAVDRLMELQGRSTALLPAGVAEPIRQRFAGGHGLHAIVGDPDHVAAELGRLADVGFVGTTVSFVNYLDEFPYFREEVLPRLEHAGLREAPA